MNLELVKNDSSLDEFFWGDQEAKFIVEQIWVEVFKASNKVLYDAGLYGYHGIELVTPNVHEMLKQLVFVDDLLKQVLLILNNKESSYDEVRQVINSRQQIMNLYAVSAALNKKSKDDFYKSIEVLKQQAAH